MMSLSLICSLEKPFIKSLEWLRDREIPAARINVVATIKPK